MNSSRSLSLKKTLIVGAIGISVFGLTAKPVFAADNLVQKIQQTITGQFERMYLQFIPGEKPGALVLKQVGGSVQNLKSFEGKTTVAVDAMGAAGSLGSGQITFAGPTVMGQVWDTSSYKQDMAVTGSLNYQGKVMEVAANVKMVDGITYVEVTKLPELGGASLDGALNTWVKFDPQQSTNAATPEPVASKWTPDQQKQLQDAFYKMLNASTVSPAKVENHYGNNVYVLTATLSKPAVAEYMTTIRQMEEVTDNSMAMTEEVKATPAEVQANTEKMLANVGELKATFWIDKSSFFPRHLELPLTIDAKNVSAKTPMAAQLPKTVPVSEVQTVTVNITSDMSKHNENFTITAPENAQDSRVFFTKIMGMFMPGMSGMMMPSGTDELPEGYVPMMPPGVRPPTIGTTELPAMTAEQKKALDQYEKMMHTTLPIAH